MRNLKRAEAANLSLSLTAQTTRTIQDASSNPANPVGPLSPAPGLGTLSVSPLLKASSSLSVAWKLYRATDSILLPLGFSRGPGSYSFLLPAVEDHFLCFEYLFFSLFETWFPAWLWN